MTKHPGALYRLLRTARRTPDRLLHSARRRRTLRRLAERPRTTRVLVMCYGNICRSPFAAARLAHLTAPLGVRVTSAGLFGPDRPTPREGCEAARARGVDLSGHRSQLVTREVVREADVIVVMDAAQARAIVKRFGGTSQQIVWLGDLDPNAIQTRRVHDPEAQAVTVFAEVYDRIERCVAAMAEALGAVPRVA